MKTKFFEVTAKCGHVGRNYYYRGLFYEKAESAKEAAAVVRQRPRVKHDHKDAILTVTEISETEYNSGRIRQSGNPYFKCKNCQQQWLIYDVIAADIYPEEEKFDYIKPKIKKPYKREKPLYQFRNYDISYIF